jgi:hypothetical protein
MLVAGGGEWVSTGSDSPLFLALPCPTQHKKRTRQVWSQEIIGLAQEIWEESQTRQDKPSVYLMAQRVSAVSPPTPSSTGSFRRDPREDDSEEEEEVEKKEEEGSEEELHDSSDSGCASENDSDV